MKDDEAEAWKKKKLLRQIIAANSVKRVNEKV